MFTVSRSKQVADRSAQTKKTAAPGARSKGMPPAARATPGARPPPAFPSIGTPASRSPSANTVNERTQKRNHDVAFPPKSSLDLGQQPLRYSRDRSKDADNPGKAKSRWAAEEFEIIDLSSDCDEDADSDDEPLARSHKRRMTSGTPNPSASQQKKPTPANPASQPSSIAPKDRQSGEGSKRPGKKSTYQDFLSRPSFKMTINSGPPKVCDPAQDPGRVRTAAGADPTGDRACAATPLENEKQELEARLEKLAADNQALSQQLRESRAISKKAIHDQLSKEREVTMLRSQLMARDLTSEKAGFIETITQLRDELADAKEDANQSAITKQNELTKLQKLLDDQALQCMKLESTVIDLRKREPSKETAAKITRLEASNGELRESKSEMDAKNSQAEKEIAKIRARYDHMKEEMRECEGRMADLIEEVEWHEGNRERMRKQWDERVAMEMGWKDSLQALVNREASRANAPWRAASRESASREATSRAASSGGEATALESVSPSGSFGLR